MKSFAIIVVFLQKTQIGLLNLFKILRYIFIRTLTLKSEGWTGYFLFYLFYDSSIILAYFFHQLFHYCTDFIAPSFRLFMQEYNQSEDECTLVQSNRILYDDVPVSLFFLIFFRGNFTEHYMYIDRPFLCNQ